MNGVRSSTNGWTARRLPVTLSTGAGLTGVTRPGAGAGVAPPQRTGEVDQRAGGQVVLEAAADLGVDELLRPIADRSELPSKVVHQSVSLPERLPSPSDPDPPSDDPPSAPSSASARSRIGSSVNR